MGRHTRHRVEERDEDDRLVSAILADLAQRRGEDASIGGPRTDQPRPAIPVGKTQERRLFRFSDTAPDDKLSPSLALCGTASEAELVALAKNPD